MPISGGDGITVLHVDDEPAFADLVATFLEREDDRISVETATSASEGLEYLSGGDVDCIVSDYDMPGTNGLEFLEAVRERHPHLPFVLFTGKGSEAVASEAISAGVTDYLQKESGSSQYAVLANRIANAVEQYRAQRALKASRKRFSMFFDQSPLGAIEWNEAFEIVRVNRTAEEILGYAEDELVGRSRTAIVPEAGGDRLESPFSSLDGDEDGRHGVRETVTKDGERLVCEWHDHVVTDDGGPVAIFSQFRDVTEKHRRRRRRERHREAVIELATAEAVTTGDFESAIQQITETAADVLDVPRVNVWLFDDEEALTCADHFDRRADAHESGMRLVAERYPAYLEALESSRSIAANDALEDPRTADLAAYLEEHDVGALLDATIRSEGEVVGVICHEHVGAPREWTDDEVQFAGDVANLVHRALRNRDRREREREFERIERRYRAIFEDPNILVGLLDPDGTLLDTNRTSMEYVDATLAEVTGEPFWETPWWDEGTRSLIRRRIERAAEGEYVEYEADLATADGSPYSVTGVIRPVTDDSGRVVSLIVSARDVTELNERERTIADLHEVATDLATCTTREEVYRHTIEAAESILEFDTAGIAVEEDGLLRMVAMSDEVPVEEPPTVAADEGVAGETYQTGESHILHDARTSSIAEPQADGIRAAVSVPLGDHGVFQVIDDAPGTFDERDRDLAELLVRHTESALDLLERERKLERRNDRLEQFTSIVSHDLRNPLTLAEGRVDLARAECDSEHLDEVEYALDRMEQLLKDLLVLSRSGDVIDEVEPVELSAVAENCWRTITAAEATLRSDGTGAIRADRNRLTQVLENLFDNAVEHGGDDVTIAVGPLENRDGFYVEDDGDGIPAVERNRIFEEGHSGSESGTGLGLSIVREIVEAHGWDISATESEAGGARFEITGVEFVA